MLCLACKFSFYDYIGSIMINVIKIIFVTALALHATMEYLMAVPT